MAKTGSLDSMVKTSSRYRHRPKPPKDYLPLFNENTRQIFNTYMEARPYGYWTDTDIRQIAQVCVLEDAIMSAAEHIRDMGIVTTGSAGQVVTNPAVAAMIKAQQQQGSILRRMGISSQGVGNSEKTRNQALEAKRLNPKSLMDEDGEYSATGLLA